MKHVKRLLAMCLAVIMMCSVPVWVSAEGVVFYNGYRDFDDDDYRTLNDWLINTPYWVVDLFAPGYTTKYLRNDPNGNDKTIDFEIIPYKGFNDTLIVSDIPEEYLDVYSDYISEGNIKDPDVKLEINNIVRKKGMLEFDYFASGKFGTKWDSRNQEYYTTNNVHLYGVLTDKQTGEIIRYDYVVLLALMYSDGTFYPRDPLHGATTKPQPANIKIPENFDPEKHEYGFCILTFSNLGTWSVVYEGEAHMYNYTKIDIPENDTPEVEPKPKPKPNPNPGVEPEPGPLSKWGDANRDGKVNLIDVSLMLKYIAGWNVKLYEKISDLSGNGRVDLIDVSDTLKIIAGWNIL